MYVYTHLASDLLEQLFEPRYFGESHMLSHMQTFPYARKPATRNENEVLPNDG
jgi:hypothetical protein